MFHEISLNSYKIITHFTFSQVWSDLYTLSLTVQFVKCDVMSERLTGEIAQFS